MLILESINHKFGRRTILFDINLRIEPGRITGLFGINGSGKSTLFNIAACLLKPLSGSIQVNGTVYSSRRPISIYSEIAYLSQDSFLPPGMTMGKLLMSFPRQSHFLFDDPIFSKLLHQYSHALSDGERRYVEICLLFSLNRNFIILDEPFTSNDPLVIETIILLIKKHAVNGAGILLTDHYHYFVTPIINDAYVLHEGRSMHLDPSGNLNDLLSKSYYLPKTHTGTGRCS